MPHKFNDARRHMFAKRRYRVTNWAEYNEALRRRGDLTIWFEEGVTDLWSAPQRRTRGGQARYSDWRSRFAWTCGLYSACRYGRRKASCAPSRG
ncbi:hypothetical protein [Borborobacter arsenicus]|uniref:hypothetical protein n=1 Tax=Borborobacter arsenicus TaxID=1851146 RepID=UPI001FE1341F|nr:hypothetical protein [Pseudaminobacter arsenicus]